MSRRAVRAAVAVARGFQVDVSRARVLTDSNNTVVYLAPTPLVAKVGTMGRRRSHAGSLARELDVACYLSRRGARAVTPADHPPPGPHVESGFELTFWRFVEHEPARDGALSVGRALRSLHEALEGYPGELPDFRDHLAEAGQLLSRPLAALREDDRLFLGSVHAWLSERLASLTHAKLPLHGEAHEDNLLRTREGLVWCDFEAACRGPVEWDLSALPDEASRCFPAVDLELLALLRRARSLCVAAWCWDDPDRAPKVREAAEFHLRTLRALA